MKYLLLPSGKSGRVMQFLFDYTSEIGLVKAKYSVYQPDPSTGLLYKDFKHNLSAENSTSCLKEYYEVVDEARPLSDFFPTHADFFFTEMHFFLIMKLSKLRSFREIRALIASQSTFEK